VRTTCFDQYWSYSGFSNITDETAMLHLKIQFWGYGLMTATHDTIRGTSTVFTSFILVCTLNFFDVFLNTVRQTSSLITATSS
jgi:hypothetical protein